MADSKISWTDKSWNPIVGCTIVSPGCTNCYAMSMARRQQYMGTKGYEQAIALDTGNWSGKITLLHDRLRDPHKWRNPCRIFVCSMSDLFHKDVPREFIKAIYGVTVDCPQHTFLVLTKRAKRLREFNDDLGGWCPNVHVGASVENQKTADERIPQLIKTIADVRWLSIEPLLESIRILDYLSTGKIHWIVVGSESRGAYNGRLCENRWIASIIWECQVAGVPVFVKQVAGSDGKVIKDVEKFPAYLQMREYIKDREGDEASCQRS